MKTKRALSIAILKVFAVIILYGQNSNDHSDLFQCQYKLNNDIYKTSQSCSITICDEDNLELRLTSISQRAPDAQFHVWKSPGGRLDYGKIKLLRSPQRYGTYEVTLTFDGQEVRKTFTVEKKEKIECDTFSCRLQGFWWGIDRKYETYLDINNYQIIVRENKNADECPVRDLFSYNVSGDTLILNNAQFRNLKLLMDFKNCNSLHLTDFQNRGFLWNRTIVFNRINGSHCDCPSDYIMKPSFFERELPKTISISVFLFLYASLLISVIYLYFKKASVQKRYSYILIMGFLCLAFSFVEWACFYLFVIHIFLYFKYVLKRITIINSVGKVVFFAIFTGLIAVFEYFLRYGFNDIGDNWISPVPIISIVIGFSLIYGFVKDGVMLTNIRLRYLFLMGFLTFGLVQGYVASKKTEIIEYVRDKITDISFTDREKCPED